MTSSRVTTRDYSHHEMACQRSLQAPVPVINVTASDRQTCRSRIAQFTHCHQRQQTTVLVIACVVDLQEHDCTPVMSKNFVMAEHKTTRKRRTSNGNCLPLKLCNMERHCSNQDTYRTAHLRERIQCSFHTGRLCADRK